MEELKPCPFCGANPEVRIRPSYNPQDTTQIQIRCPNKICMGRSHRWLTNENEALILWNRRYHNGQ